jgi:hypothetical protein
LQRPGVAIDCVFVRHLNSNQHKLGYALKFSSRRDLLQTIDATCWLPSLVSSPFHACRLGLG